MRMLLTAWLVTLTLLGGLRGRAIRRHPATATAPKLDAPWIPSAPAVIAVMLEAAHVGFGDTLYDLGCGEGEIVIAAARRGARGVGVDIDPERIVNARRNAAQAGVTDRVTFIEQDLFADRREPGDCRHALPRARRQPASAPQAAERAAPRRPHRLPRLQHG